jgi:hypothetical protein
LQPDVAKVEAHFERALAAARQDEAKSWERHAATRMARLCPVQGSRNKRTISSRRFTNSSPRDSTHWT